MPQVNAYGTQGAAQPLAPLQIARRELEVNDVAVDIAFCGVCHTDIHQTRNEWGNSMYPMVPGHEIVGKVTAVGSKVKRFKAGDKVGVGCLVDSCRECEDCKDGLEQFCCKPVFTYNSFEKDGKTLVQGGYSTKIVVHQDFILRIPDNLSLDKAAPLLCAGITTYSPLRHWKTGPGKRVAVLGLGGLGHMAVKLGHAMKAEITVLTRTLNKIDDAKRLGADHVYATNDPKTFEKLSRYFDLIINTVSVKLDWGKYLEMLKRDGSMVLLGVPSDAPQLPASPLIMARRSLAGSLIGGIKETQEMLDFCGKHNIASDIELIPITKINEAYERILKSDVKYRFVIDIATLK
ncbi:MAG: NAD(P)-dependent alcohol dehydrogenase [Candidatus Omnitrophica bacterium]|nr:NAD(P)-dependent alcohol dehydrogenase [Candidatus Omnitrophota bacterium]